MDARCAESGSCAEVARSLDRRTVETRPKEENCQRFFNNLQYRREYTIQHWNKSSSAIAIYPEVTRQTLNSDTYLTFGEFLKRQQRWEEAIAQYQLAIKSAELQHNDLLIARSHRGIGEALIGTGQPAAAKTELEQARSLFQDVACIDLASETAREIRGLP